MIPKKFKMTAIDGKRKYYIDDFEVKHVISCNVFTEVGNPVKVKIEFYADIADETRQREFL
jgi:hypothetical protein